MFSRLTVALAFLVHVTLALVVPESALAQPKPASTAAAPIDLNVLPPELVPWRAWALGGKDGDQSFQCPLYGALRSCAWPTALSLSVEAKRATFSFDVTTVVDETIGLPGDAEHWPLSVRVDGKAVPVVAFGAAATPSVQIGKGKHRIEGSFSWDAVPVSIKVPPSLGLVSLRVKYKEIAVPRRDQDGTLWLSTEGSESASEIAAEADTIEVRVHRKVTDEIPLRLTTLITLNVSGKSRELVLGKPLSDTFLPLSVNSPIPVRFDSDGHLRVQVRPGTHVITLEARSKAQMLQIARPAPDGVWHQGDEAWVFEAVNSLRVVTVTDVTPVDPSLTAMPEAWKKLPAYFMGDKSLMVFKEKQRGDANPGPERLRLSRELWLDFDGSGATVRDALSGDMKQTFRLEMTGALELGRVSIASRDVFITKQAGSNFSGVEVRQGSVSASADGRLRSLGMPLFASIPAVGWNHDVESAQLSVALPVGWDVFHARGVDSISNSWVNDWRLLEIFLCMVLTVAFGRLFGLKWGAVAFVGLSLSLTRSDATTWFWFVPLVLEAVRRFASSRSEKYTRWLRYTQVATLAILALNLLPFAINEARVALHPALQDSVESNSRARGLEGAMEGRSGGGNAKSEASPEPMAQALDETKNAADMPAAAVPSAVTEKAAAGKKDASVTSSILPSKVAPRQSASGYFTNAGAYDPKAVVQTGPGIPTWSARMVTLGFNGPVKKDQVISLVLLSPNMLFGFTVLRLSALAALLVCLMRAVLKGFRINSPAAALLVFAILFPRTARAEIPTSEMLEQLSDRLRKPPTCAPNCSNIDRMALQVSGSVIRMRLEVSAQAEVGVPLPGGLAQWVPDRVTVDGAPAALFRDAAGVLIARLATGVRTIELTGRAPTSASLQIHLPMKPRFAQAFGPGFAVEGIHEDGQCDETLQISREAKASEKLEKLDESAESTVSVPVFVGVERTLHVGLSWQVSTRVTRVAAAAGGNAAIVLQIPLLAGESPTTDVKLDKGKVQVNIPAGVEAATWESTFAERPIIELSAAQTLDWTEVWRLDLGPMWHANLSGLTVIHHAQSGIFLPEWRPWPGESAKIEISKPEGVGGQTVTLDRSQLTTTPGIRASDVEVSFTLRSSKGGEHTIELPEGAELREVKISGALVPLTVVGRKLVLPIRPGAQDVSVSWREQRGISAVYSPSAPNLGAPLVNATSVVNLALASRWVLFLRGPILGPSVIFWSLFLVLVAVAYGLSRIRWVSLKAWEWMLLFVGLTQTSAFLAAVFALWLVALAYRGRPEVTASLGVTRARLYNVIQLALLALSLTAMIILVSCLYRGLLGDPEMQIQGFGSSDTMLKWYEDRVSGPSRAPLVISVPILVYRFVMLAWALWLAFAVLRWVKIGFNNAASHGLWRTTPKVSLAAAIAASAPSSDIDDNERPTLTNDELGPSSEKKPE
jgi:hypothetical protein